MSFLCATPGCRNIITDAKSVHRKFCKECQLRKKRNASRTYKKNGIYPKGLP